MLKITSNSKYNLENKNNIIIVPEMFSHEYERYLCEEYGNDISKTTEVLTFSRFPTRIFEEIGGLSNNYINNSGRILAVYNAIEKVSTTLKIFKNNKIEIILKILDVIDQFKMYQIDENKILETAKQQDGILSDKLYDLFFIYAEYNKITSDEFLDPRDEIEFLKENFYLSSRYDKYNVYFDKFSGFTPQQLSIISEMLQKNMDVTITLDIKEKADNIFDFCSTSRETLQTIKKLCAKINVEYIEDFSHENKNKFDDLSENLFEFNDIKIDNQDIFMHISNNIQDECMYVAGKIIDLVRDNDIRYKDIVVTARNFDEYKKHLEVVFKRFEIPIFISAKDDITQKSPIKFLITALDILQSNYKSTDVYKFLKLPIKVIPNNEICVLEEYTTRWNIEYLPEKLKFVSNPSYKIQKNSAKNIEKLEELNQYKLNALSDVYTLEKEFLNAKTGHDFVKSLYNFCENSCLAEKILSNDELRNENSQLWDIIIGSLDQFIEISGNQEMTADEFISLYKILISSYQMSIIPSFVDNITAGGFDRILGEKPKVLFIMGATESSLPANAKESPILNDFDLDEIKENIKINPFGTDLITREFELIYNIFKIPTDKIFVSYPQSGHSASSVFKRIKEICKDVKISNDTEYLYNSKKIALEQFVLNGEIKKAQQLDEFLEKFMRDDKIFSEFLKAENKISPTKLDVYNSCQFKYFMQYILKLKPKRLMEFDSLENGNFIHYILENILKNNKSDDINAQISNLINQYKDNYFSDNFKNDVKFRYILEKLMNTTEKIVENVLKEVKLSEFKPVEFEFDLLYNKSTLDINDFEVIGKVDRIDCCENGNYMRIVDYKSGVKKFDNIMLENGLDMQMFVYMMAISTVSKYKNSIPAGVLYIPTKVPSVKMDIPSDELKEKEVKTKLKRSGVIIKDEDIVKKMDSTDDLEFLPIKYTKTGFDKRSSILVENNEFDDIVKKVHENVLTTVSSMKVGDIKANPYKYDKKTPCNYCDYKNCCGFSEKYEQFRIIEKGE